jgi:hypothetical protein
MSEYKTKAPAPVAKVELKPAAPAKKIAAQEDSEPEKAASAKKALASTKKAHVSAKPTAKLAANPAKSPAKKPVAKPSIKKSTKKADPLSVDEIKPAAVIVPAKEEVKQAKETLKHKAHLVKEEENKSQSFEEQSNKSNQEEKMTLSYKPQEEKDQSDEDKSEEQQNEEVAGESQE